jgi:hypothetical protein
MRRSADTGRWGDEPTRLYAQAAPEDQLALRVWMRDIILGREVGRANTVRARRSEKRMVEACERRILEFPLGHGRTRGRQGAKTRGVVCLGVRL